MEGWHLSRSVKVKGTGSVEREETEARTQPQPRHGGGHQGRNIATGAHSPRMKGQWHQWAQRVLRQRRALRAVLLANN